MSDIIQLLPDNVANQIAAGEVVQRPASVVKELMENAIDAGSTKIKVNIKDAGRTLIQILDNGKGMSETDARMSFERHATSKISSAEDIFEIRTMGFRGEALASIAAVAQVEMKTKQADDELGVEIHNNASVIEKQEACTCTEGTNISVKNLFYNIPVRRKFLKSNAVELRHIFEDFQRIALANTDINFSLHSNGADTYNLPKSNLKQRIVNIFGKKMEKQLLPIQVDTSIVKIHGFIGTPEGAKKRGYEQFFFVNNRYMKHPYFYRSLMKTYDGLIQDKSYPSFFIFFEVDPQQIDVNIHPTKTEIKFSDEADIAQILEAAAREALGKFNLVPSIDFDDDTNYNDMFSPSSGEVKIPSVEINPSYNPFDTNTSKSTSSSGGSSSSSGAGSKPKLDTQDKYKSLNWETLFSGFENERTTEPETLESSINTKEEEPEQKQIEVAPSMSRSMQVNGRYIFTPIKSGIMIIDQRRAHQRILFERYLDKLKTQKVSTQKSLFPISIDLQHHEFAIIVEMMPELKTLGFDIEIFGKTSIIINGTPAEMESNDLPTIIQQFLEDFDNADSKVDINEKVAKSMAMATAINYGQTLTSEEMNELTDSLFACKSPNYAPNGKKAVIIMAQDEIAKKFD